MVVAGDEHIGISRHRTFKDAVIVWIGLHHIQGQLGIYDLCHAYHTLQLGNDLRLCPSEICAQDVCQFTEHRGETISEYSPLTALCQSSNGTPRVLLTAEK